MVRRRGRQQSNTTFAEGTEIAETFAAIEKKYGAVARKGSEIILPLRIPTGAFIFDFATLGGIPQGRQNMVVGEKHAGKTMIACKAMKYAQIKYPDSVAIVLDCEKAFDTVWAGKLGVDLDRLHVIESEVGEAAVDMADILISTEEVSILVIDSLAAMLPTREAEASAEDNHMGLQSRLVGELCRKMSGSLTHGRLRGHEPVILYINQFRIDISKQWGDKRIAPGGRALEHFPSLTWRMLNHEKMGQDENDIDVVAYNEHEFALTKNKLNNGPRTGLFRLCRYEDADKGLHEGDIDDSGTLLTYAKKFGYFKGGGKTWKLEYGGHSFTFESKDKGSVFLNKNRGVYWSLYNYLIRDQAIVQGMPHEFLERFDIEIHDD